MPEPGPIIAIAGNVATADGAPAAAEALGRELAQAGFRVLVYSSRADFAEASIVRGYVASQQGQKESIQVRYPLHGTKPEFTEQISHGDLFDWRPDHSPDWEISFYRSLMEVDGLLLIGGGPSTLVAGIAAMGYRIAVVPIPSFGGHAVKVWEAMQPSLALATADEISLMARPVWSDDLAAQCVATFRTQLARKAELEKQRRLDEIRRETAVTLHACFAVALFLLAILAVGFSWGGGEVSHSFAIWLLFIVPLLAGVSGATIRLVFDLRQGSVPLSRQSAITTGALGLIAGGLAGLLFITAQASTSASPTEIISTEQAKKLILFCVLVGFTAGLTLDAVFRKMIDSDLGEVKMPDRSKKLW
jgi:hypothetical protein